MLWVPNTMREATFSFHPMTHIKIFKKFNVTKLKKWQRKHSMLSNTYIFNDIFKIIICFICCFQHRHIIFIIFLMNLKWIIRKRYYEPSCQMFLCLRKCHLYDSVIKTNFENTVYYLYCFSKRVCCWLKKRVMILSGTHNL